MGAIFEQLGIDHTYFIQLGLFLFMLVVLSRMVFIPFLELFESRYKQTVQDKETAAKLAEQAEQKLSQYQQKLSEARSEAHRAVDEIVKVAKAEETKMIATARGEVKDILQKASTDMVAQKTRLKSELKKDVDDLAKSVSNKLLVTK